MFQTDLLRGKRVLVTGGGTGLGLAMGGRCLALGAAMLSAIWQAGPLDALVNNAAGNFLARTEELSPRAVDAVLGIVLHGSAYVTLGCGKRWLAEGHKASVLSIVTTYAWTGSA